MSFSIFFSLSETLKPIAIILIALFSVFAAGFAGLIIYFLIKNIKNDSLFAKQMSTTLFACFNLRDRTVTSFLKHSVAKVKKLTIAKFVETLKPADREKLLAWLENIRINSEDIPTFIRCTVPTFQTTTGKKTVNPSNGLFELDRISDNREKVSVIIHKLSFTPFDQTKWANNYNSIRRQLAFTLFGSQFPNALYFIRFSLTDDVGSVSAEEPVAYTLIVDKLSRETASMLNTELYELDRDLLLIVQTPNNPSFNYEEVGRLWLRKINQIISSNFWDLNIGASIGGITSADSKQVRTLLEEGQKLANSASDEEGDEAIAFFSDSRKAGADVLFRSAFSHILEGNSLAVQFQPILNPLNSKEFGYHAKLELKSSPFEDLRELRLYASRHSLTQSLFKEYITETIAEFETMYDRRHYARLFVNVSPNEVAAAQEVLANIDKPEYIELVLIINEEEIDSEEAEDRTFLASLHQLRQTGCELALLLENEQFPEVGEIYKRFDYFVPPNIKIEHKNKDDNYAVVFYTRLLEKLLAFKKPVISIAVDGWPRVELLVRLGVDYISSDDISSYSITLKEIDKRKQIRLARFAE